MAEPGWYPDPDSAPEQDPDLERYWDGEEWHDTRAVAEAMPQGWYPDPEKQPDTERYWDGQEWWSTRSATPPPSPKPKRNGPSFRHYILTSIGMMVIMAGVGYFADRDEPQYQPGQKWTEQECAEAVLNELIVIRSEVEFPTMTEWFAGSGQNPVFDADEISRTRCNRDGRTPLRFDWSGVRDDFAALRAHLQWDRPRPTIDEITPLAEIEEWLAQSSD